jgi:ribosome biogenesis protein BMS1
LYPKRDVLNLTRYLYNIKIPRIPWRQHHPYVMVDRWEIAEDRTYKDEDNVKINFYGYIRNSSYRINTRLHLVGLGDCDMHGFEVI